MTPTSLLPAPFLIALLGMLPGCGTSSPDPQALEMEVAESRARYDEAEYRLRAFLIDSLGGSAPSCGPGDDEPLCRGYEARRQEMEAAARDLAAATERLEALGRSE